MVIRWGESEKTEKSKAFLISLSQIGVEETILRHIIVIGERNTL
jgi:hypothetical protein